MNKQIYVETFGYKPHSLYNSLFENPPEGYEFIVPENKEHHSRLGKYKIIRFLNNIRKRFSNPILKRYEAMKDKKVDCDFVYSIGNILPYDKPYIVDFENVLSFMGWDKRLFLNNKKFLEIEFLKDKCRYITTWDYEGVMSIINNLDCKGFIHKIKMIPIAINNIDIDKEHFKGGKIRMLFLSSINLPDDFYMKGGKEALEIFAILQEKGYDVELNITGTIPKELKYYEKMDNLNVLGLLSKERLHEVMLQSDILLSPIHNTPALAFLEAMNYEMAIVTSDVLGNRERVINGKNGILIPFSAKVIYLKDGLSNVRQKDYNKQIKIYDEDYIERFVDAIEKLIRNQDEIVRMGKEGKKMIHDEYSIEKRNDRLKELFDDVK